MLRMLKIKKGSIAWEYVAALILALLAIVLFALFSSDIKTGILDYLKELFKGGFWS